MSLVLYSEILRLVVFIYLMRKCSFGGQLIFWPIGNLRSCCHGGVSFPKYSNL